MIEQQVAAIIQKEIQSYANKKKAAWLENYVKHDIQSRGVGIPVIRKIIHKQVIRHEIEDWEWQMQTDFLDFLLESAYTEDKLAAILFLQLYGGKATDRKLLYLIEKWFDLAWINDWNVCDWLCVRLLTPMLDRGSDLALDVFRMWNDAPYLWKARASLVPFAQSKRIAEFKSDIQAMSTVLIKREERFCKTAVGWVMRQLSRHDEGLVQNFLSVHNEYLTAEVRRNATKYM